MKRMRFAGILSCLGLLAVVSCAPPEPEGEMETEMDMEPAADTMADEQAIDQLNREYEAAATEGDVEALVAFYAADAIVMPSAQPTVRGAEGVRSWLSAFYAENASTLTIEREGIEVVGDLAYSWGTYTQMVTPKAEGEPGTVLGRYLVLFERGADGSWDISHLSLNDAPAGGEAMPAGEPMTGETTASPPA